ncbi:TetR/AcrR family transcriptional regulator [Noviherbaspirillum sp. ST9]|uniref:TetR/AcrR family transcriptional regulator n=1 Tax=Noviherbaspirillum sp. ST9 TaxID=3401606 RepID=UPI003B58741E
MRSATPEDNHSRPRGRPTKSEADQAEIRNRLLNATAAAYGETGYHALSVKAILEKAELSRPTFYRHFSNVDEPLRLVIAGAHHGLVDRLVTRIPAEAPIEQKMAHAVELYLDWAKSMGPLLRPFYVELHDPYSPVSELRPQVLARIVDLYTKTIESSGAKVQSRLLVELMVTGIEFLGYRYYLERGKGRITLAMIKDAMWRLMACTLAEPGNALKPRK